MIQELEAQYVVVLSWPDGGLPTVFGPFETVQEAEEWELPPGVDHDDPAVVPIYQPATWVSVKEAE